MNEGQAEKLAGTVQKKVGQVKKVFEKIVACKADVGVCISRIVRNER
jgi:uncharacterized protein YjbJ (UPF0337 family)